MRKSASSILTIAILCGAVYVAHSVLSVSNIIIWLFGLTIALVMFGFQLDRRIAAMEERAVENNFTNIIKQIEEGDRHLPEHQQPASLVAGGAIESWINSSHQILFEDFRWFAAVMNRHLADAWVIEELNDTSVRGIDGPDIGRRYQVWYNACKMGTLQVTVAGFGSLKPEQFESNKSACLDLELHYLRFVPYQDAHNLIYNLALFMRSFDLNKDHVSRADASFEASRALSGYLWETVRVPDYSQQFEYSMEGPYELLRRTVDQWKSSGIDPFAKWGADVPPEERV